MDKAAFGRAYRYWRAFNYPATLAKVAATRDVEDGRNRYPESGGAGMGAPFGNDGLRWVENPRAAGLRWVGFADEIAGRSVSHRGWYRMPDGLDGEVYRGAVWQLPGKGGRARYVAGYREGSETKRGWQDSAYLDDRGAGAIAFGEIFEGEPPEWPADSYGAHREAAFRADSIAESYAESEREWHEAWQAGSRAADLEQEGAAAREEARALIREIGAWCRALRDAGAMEPGDLTRRALKARIRDKLETWRDNMTESAELWANCPSRLESAFLEGKGA